MARPTNVLSAAKPGPTAMARTRINSARKSPVVLQLKRALETAILSAENVMLGGSWSAAPRPIHAKSVPRDLTVMVPQCSESALPFQIAARHPRAHRVATSNAASARLVTTS